MIRLKLEGVVGTDGGGKWPQRVMKIMKIASPCQVDVCNGLKLPAIKS